MPSWARADWQVYALQDGGDRQAVPHAGINAPGVAQAAFAAGASLALFDQFLRTQPPFAGALRQRLALRAAAACAKPLRLREDESDLRDALHLTLPGADPGRAGRLHSLWCRLARPITPLDETPIAAMLALIGAPASIDAGRLAALWQAGAMPRHPLAAATRAARAASLPPEFGIEGEILALWLADFWLAQSLGWGQGMPLLATRILGAGIVRGVDGRRLRPSDADWPMALTQAYGLALNDALGLAQDFCRRTRKLLELAPKLRAKGASRVIDMLLADDAASPAGAARIAGLSDRAARRLFDRLVAEGGVRELSGRASFRLYGL
ncbi:MAG: DUF1403 family protein [Hyphomicrobiales bacterium]|nr:DUF1403 family protein [Hyphomicrobiales bacterium]